MSVNIEQKIKYIVKEYINNFMGGLSPNKEHEKCIKNGLYSILPSTGGVFKNIDIKTDSAGNIDVSIVMIPPINEHTDIVNMILKYDVNDILELEDKTC